MTLPVAKITRIKFQICLLVLISIREFAHVHCYTYKSFSDRTICTSKSSPISPNTLSDLQNIVKSALIDGQKVKPIGQLHSTSEVICTEGIPVNMSNINHFSYNPETTLATVGAGLTLTSFMDSLHTEFRALTGAPIYSGLSVGGVVATGAHGTSASLPSTLSDQLVSVTIVDGLGKVRKVNETEELFKAIQVNLGLLGIVYELVFRTVPQFKFQIRAFPVPDEILFNSTKIQEYADNNDFFNFSWFPTAKQVVLFVGGRVDIQTPGTCEVHLFPEVNLLLSIAAVVSHEILQAHRDRVGFFLIQQLAILSHYKQIPGRTPIYTKADGSTMCGDLATGFSHKMITGICKECFWEHGGNSVQVDGSFTLFPKSELLPALKTLRQIVTEYPVEFTVQGMSFRFLTESNSYIGMNSRRPTVELELRSAARLQRSQPRLGLAPMQAMGQALLDEHQGRPHWGVHEKSFATSKIFRRAYPQLDKFIAAMDEMDPKRIFMNNLGRVIRSEWDYEVDGKYCALREECICESDWHCGNGGELDFQCGTLQGYKVCREKPNFIYEVAAAASNHVISVLAAINLSANELLNLLSGRDGFRHVGDLKRGIVENLKKMYILYLRFFKLT